MVDIGGLNPEAISYWSAGVVQDVDGANGGCKAVAAADVLDAKAISVSPSLAP
jgi:hypothetical protein